MRGIYNSVTDIRRKVFTEIARLAYEGGDYAGNIEKLPFKIIPGERQHTATPSSWSVPLSVSVCALESVCRCEKWMSILL